MFMLCVLPGQWSEDPCAAHLNQRDGYQATTQGQLKDQLYQETINYFDKGKVRTPGAGLESLKVECMLTVHTSSESDIN